MNYIVLDLEWNQAYETESNDLVPFEIIEIGAVKLNSQMELVDEFQEFVKPLLYPRLHFKVKEMLGYKESYLRRGRPFHIVCREFLKWCGEDYRFVTWGELDLEQLQRNMEYYGLRKLPKPLAYYNLQRIYGKIFKESAACSLEHAVDQMKISKEYPFHRAVNDAHYTGQILQCINPDQVLDEYTYDTYNNPKNKDEELHKRYKDSYQYISREFSSKKNVVNDKEIMAIHCPMCNTRINKKIKWFVNNQTVYYCGGKCKIHGCFIGKLKFKTTQTGKLYVIKTMKLTDENGIHYLRERQEELRLKRRERAKKQKKMSKISSNN